MDRVVFDRVHKDLRKIPNYILEKLMIWAKSVELKGIREVRKIPGYHDEPLKGTREGQRSVRLNRSYRAIYQEEHDGTISIVLVIEVNKHEY